MILSTVNKWQQRAITQRNRPATRVGVQRKTVVDDTEMIYSPRLQIKYIPARKKVVQRFPGPGNIIEARDDL